MNATEQQIDSLKELQQIDIDYVRTKKKFEEMPQREQILQARTKLAALDEKMSGVKDMLAKCRFKSSELDKKDACAQKRGAELQKNIEQSTDFRNIEKKTKELAGLQKQREQCAEKMEALLAEEKKIAAVMHQIQDAQEKLAAAEQNATNSFKAEGGALQKQIHALEDARAKLEGELDAELAGHYKKAAGAGAGVAISELKGDSCSVCRTKLQEARLLQAKKEAPLTLCPNCKRLMIVEK